MRISEKRLKKLLRESILQKKKVINESTLQPINNELNADVIDSAVDSSLYGSNFSAMEIDELIFLVDEETGVISVFDSSDKNDVGIFNAIKEDVESALSVELLSRPVEGAPDQFNAYFSSPANNMAMSTTAPIESLKVVEVELQNAISDTSYRDKLYPVQSKSEQNTVIFINKITGADHVFESDSSASQFISSISTSDVMEIGEFSVTEDDMGLGVTVKFYSK